MCTCTITGTFWRAADCSGTGPWQGATSTDERPLPARADCSGRPNDLRSEEATLSTAPARGREDGLSISDA